MLYCVKCGMKWKLDTVCPGCGGKLLAQDKYSARIKMRARWGNAMAQNRLGVLYITGDGMRRDYEKAKDCFMKAAWRGNAAAQNNLGVMYADGHGVRQDYAKAAQWYRKAAGQGDAMAQRNLRNLEPLEAKGLKRDAAAVTQGCPQTDRVSGQVIHTRQFQEVSAISSQRTF